MALDNEKLQQLVDAEFENSMGIGELATERAKAWDYYMSKLRGDEIDGQSQVVSSDVSDVVDSIMPSLLRIFTTADNVVSFDPVGGEDIEQAEQESDYVNHVFFKKNKAFMILYTWFFDALVQKNGVVKCWWDETEKVTSESYEDLTEDELLNLMGDDELEPVERAERQADVLDEKTGEMVPGTLHDITFNRVSKDGRILVDNVPPDEYRISKDARNLDPSEARFSGHERPVTRSELLEMGFDKKVVEGLSAIGDTTAKPEDKARRDKSDETGDDSDDKSQELVLLREGYMKVDADEDGRAERLKIFTAGGTFLEQEPADRTIFHVISPQPLPHKHFGRATAEKVMDVQDINTTLVRQSLTNLYHANNPGHAVWVDAMGDDTMDDLLTTRVGRVVRFDAPVDSAYSTISIPFTAGASFQAMEFFNKVKKDRTGISSDSEGLSPEALKNIQTTVLAQANDLGRMKVEAVARIFAETGIMSLMLHIHELTLKHRKKPEIVQLRNKFVSVDPTSWKTRTDLTANIGLGIGTREQNNLHLNAIWDKQKQMVEGGGMNVTVTPKNIYNTAAEFVKNANLKQPSMFFTDPGDAKGAAPSGEQEQLQKQQMELAKRQQELDQREQQLKQGKLIQANKAAADKHRLDIAELNRKREADKDTFMVNMEKLATQLTELELKFNTNVPGAKV